MVKHGGGSITLWGDFCFSVGLKPCQNERKEITPDRKSVV